MTLRGAYPADRGRPVGPPEVDRPAWGPETDLNCRRLIDAYVNWLRKGLEIEQLEGACELTTPFLDRHNDHLQIYAERRNGGLLLSDDGYTVADLQTSGPDLDTPKRRQAFETILNGFGVRAEAGELVVDASETTLGQRIHSLLQAMLAVNDMFVLAQPRFASLFLEDVRAFLDDHEVRYSENVKLAGRSGYDHLITFLIPRSRSQPERLVQAINAPARNTVGSYLFTLADTRALRGDEARTYAFLNDRDREVGGVVEALDAYSVVPARWSERERYAEELAG